MSSVESAGAQGMPATTSSGEEVLRVDSVSKTFPARGGKGSRVHALSDVSFSLHAGETLAVVGESGSGKSTLARVAMRLLDPDSGSVIFNGVDVTRTNRRSLMSVRRQMQMVFQDPYSSLNSRMTIAAAIQEPAVVHNVGDSRSRLARAGELLELVGLRGSDLRKYPHQFSGGQRQRICIARALMLETKVLVLDEPVSALDVSTQAQVVNLLKRLQGELGLAYLFVSHDLSVVRHVADQLLVMYLGRSVETGPSETIFTHPSHPYTASLLSAVPSANPRDRESRQRIILSGELPDPSNPPAGCCFNTRCWKATELCFTNRPVLAPSTDQAGQLAACHFPLELSSVSPHATSTR